MFRSALQKAQERLVAFQRQNALRKVDTKKLPPEIASICRYLSTGCYPDAAAEQVALRAEKIRQRIASSNVGPIEIFYSPKPGSVEDANRPQAGATLLFSPERIAKTGKDKRWGGFLHLCAQGSGAKLIVELGACAGISAYYMATAPNVRRLITIEGSSALAAIARETLSELPNKVEVINALFDDALNQILTPDLRIDLAYIDGHHEKVATIHYFNRMREYLNKGAWVIFDDISWSTDMRDCWHEVIVKPGFSHCFDFGAVGVCIWDGRAETGEVVDLRAVSGVREIGKPHGWDHQPGAVVQ